MSADRELLELAAKAIGMTVFAEGVEWPADKKGWFFNQVGDHPPALYDASSSMLTMWAPLTDDSDALRLAVALDMDVGQGYEMAFASATILAAPDQEYCEATNMIIDRVRLPGERTESIHAEADTNYSDHSGDKVAATRRAILLCAAEVGRAMP